MALTYGRIGPYPLGSSSRDGDADLAALGLLLSVIDLGSLGRAAQAQNISQPSAGSRIRCLEQLVGAPPPVDAHPDPTRW
ncbi:LysR family transcriptional regulator [Streptomyces sp. NBC_01343]|uniref:helix-turn-helix domain-containing protein n=1 Tax=Streptomyces sp. NBC_01343 TaxID=2903832 RepID=UPI002E12E3CB|nr:LysR family transcriptional regulator [Streptomyces sp. NBC_01343]